MRWVPLLLGLSGCQLVFELGDPAVDANGPDAGVPDSVALVDEDTDGVPDDTDNCPGMSNGGQGSLDGDDVGDICDPASNVSGDAIVLREMFATGVGEASPSGTSVTAVGGSLVTGGDADDVTVTLALPAVDTRNRFGLYAEVGFRILDLGTPANSNLFQVEVAASSGGVACLVSNDTGTPLAQLRPKGGDIVDLDAPTVAIDTPYRMVVGAHEEDGAFCSFEGSRAESTGTARGNGTVRVVIQQMRVQVDYIVIYDTDRDAPVN